jgi:hypothetical protein
MYYVTELSGQLQKKRKKGSFRMNGVLDFVQFPVFSSI